jgi:hypothetical protein
MDEHEELDNWKAVKYRMREEGMDYCFRHYSSFKEINDNTFHYLRQLLEDAMDRMDKLVQDRIEDLETKLETEDGL